MLKNDMNFGRNGQFQFQVGLLEVLNLFSVVFIECLCKAGKSSHRVVTFALLYWLFIATAELSTFLLLPSSPHSLRPERARLGNRYFTSCTDKVVNSKRVRHQ